MALNSSIGTIAFGFILLPVLVFPTFHNICPRYGFGLHPLSDQSRQPFALIYHNVSTAQSYFPASKVVSFDLADTRTIATFGLSISNPSLLPSLSPPSAGTWLRRQIAEVQSTHKSPLPLSWYI